MDFYSGESEKEVGFLTEILISEKKAAKLEDSLFCVKAPNPLTFKDYPAACRWELQDLTHRSFTRSLDCWKILMEYSKHVQ